ncbi:MULTISPECIES: siderophore ABC transporter substrate-binding protein [unclassified Gilliamella]|uniref:siderophore ABC transporter substrate-binding protein n=1 Tax=unclassified Gilliamella TaxID=2685620 RepID=UPI002269F1DC|nr:MULTISPECIES: siderophore ABC transporter substrate-binding protein [unclassified Gilliamella]MCX8641336.1 siderophore ABC transporter substrate-binding protein [Gilliamella sp. B3835]MCX8707446.1 siderophore ABC transporter substrate-binding protein [Gilliamella sp. B3783]MCX8710526.1 siderophore ABC transporter substrate-binding protein [Gilliamella sp. B3780]MCX8711305.1 siderophore ABC transporter substrate-binding protein [Gilliamella sp. B3468]MCX8714641.1 siderophore ABC transporter 
MYSRIKFKFIVLLTALFVLAGCDDNKKNEQSSVNKITIEHAQGKTDVPENPKKVVVFNIATLDIMDALNIPVSAVPQSDVHFPDFLSKYSDKSYTNVGTLFEPNYEVLSSLAPDVIIAGGRANDVYNKLNDIAPTISLDIDPNNFLASLTQRTEQLGTLFNKQDQAKKLIADFNQKIEQLKPKTNTAGSALVIMVNGGKMSAYGPKSRFGFIFDILGFKPATTFQEAGRHGNAVTSEFILSVNPQWLFVLDRDNAIGNKEAQSAQQVLNNDLIQKTDAWQNNHIVYLDSTSMYIAGGIQTYSHLMDQISEALQKTSAN